MKRTHTRGSLLIATAIVAIIIATLFTLPRQPGPAPAPLVATQAASVVNSSSTEAASEKSSSNEVASSKTEALLPPRLLANAMAASPAGTASSLEEMRRFSDWVARYQQAGDATSKASLEAEGEALARERREVMARLIEEDPQRALQEAVSFAQRQQLPATITAQLEQPVSGRGDLRVLGVLPDAEGEGQSVGVLRTVQLDDKDYRAFVYGRRLSQPTRENIPLHGIAIGDALALHQSPLRVLDSAEAAARANEVDPKDAQCPISKKPVSVEDAAAVVEVGRQVRILCNGGHIEVLEGQLLADEGVVPSGEVVAAALDSWSQGPKTLLYIRVRFFDQTNDPQTLIDSKNMMNSVSNFFVEGSYETTSITTTFTPVYTLSNNTAYYTNAGIYTLRTDALAAAKADGFDSVNWNLDAVRYNGGPGAFSGAAYVGARGCWLKSSSAGVAAHEFGHNYRLWHANSWNPTDESPIGPGTWQEYGDSFDTMGAAGAGAYHYCARYKGVLNWIPPEGLLTTSASGTYRVYAHDYITSSNQVRGLRVPRDANKNYWVEFRQKFTGNTWLMNGAGIRRADNSNNNNPGSELLDTTPGSPDGKTDSALLIGRTFSDANAGVHITPIGKGGTAPESLDVVVNLGTFAANGAPTLSISASSTAVAVGSPVTFTASASDPNGDTLAYFWDFDDKTYGLNTTTLSKSWNTAGEYVVRCVASDMKGATATRWVVITVGTPNVFRISGRIMDASGNPLENVRVHNGKTSTQYRGCFTDVDGYYTIANLASGSYTVGAASFGFVFTPSGFSNPLSVGPSKTDANFAGSVKTYRITGRLTDGGVPVASVQVSDGFRSGLSNTNGDYAINNVPNGSYTVTASKSGYTFTQSGWSNPVIISDADSTNKNFVTPTYTISGEITGLATTTIVTVTDGYRTTTSYKQNNGPNAKNIYSLSGVPAGSWNLRATLVGSSFSPSGFSNPLTITGNASSKNFALDAVTTYSISGTITFNGFGLSGVTVTAGSQSSITDSRGGFFLRGLANGTYDVVPSFSGYGFTPPGTTVTIASANVSGQNFSSTQAVLPTITLAATDADASEPGSNAGRFTVTRTGSTAAALTVLYTVNGTATGGSDFAALPGSVTIPVGTTSADITVTPLNDADAECMETVAATLAANVAYVLGFPYTGTVNITDNDLPAVSIVALDTAVWENGGTSATLRVTRNGCTTAALTVNYSVNGTAVSGSDYTALSGSVTIPAGATSANVIVTPIDELGVDGDKTIIVTITGTASYSAGAPATASVTILDNETNHAPQVDAGPDQTVSILGLANLGGTVTDDGLPGSGLTYTWSKISGPGTVVAANLSAEDTTACFSMTGTYVLKLTASDGSLSASDDVTITVTAADSSKILNAINAGGLAYTDAQGIVYRADTWFDAGTAGSTVASIAATDDGALYQTDRNGDFSYNIPVSGGSHDYLVTLKFAETTATAQGQRVFDVSVDGQPKAQNLDLFTQAGANSAFDLVMPITATGDVLNIQFQTKGSAFPAKINAIVVGAAQVLSPAAPSNLAATVISSSQIDLAWADNSANETSFQLQVSTDGSTFVTLATLGANATSYSHTGLSPVTTYYYRVRACNSAGCSEYATDNDTTLNAAPFAPSNLTATAVSGNQINLSWSDNSSNENGFTIERSLDGTSFTQTGTVGPNVTAYASTGLLKNTRYYFRIRAYNDIGVSAYSNTTNTRTKPK